MTNKSSPTLLFDLDGTLADTAPDLCAAMNYVLGTKGLEPVPTEIVRGMIGGGARMILKRGLAYRNVSISEDELDKDVDDFVIWYMDNIDTHTKIFPHIENILQTAKKANIGLAVVTNKRFDLSEKLLTKLGLLKYFGTLVAGDTLPTRKPDPGMIYEAMKRLNGDPSQTIMIGDSEADTLAAQNAGIPCICVSFGYSLQPVQSLGAEALIDDYETFYDTVTALRPMMGHHLSQISQ
ncbi:hypothetical protein IMCC14465_04210 [alpha proteobacterium IMCC14465]|uniref:phosphoglycolate phosphatase n=1 Tax=alpha proteobacterium IMCC14465 TaxID=1220535 RepID=J9DYG3_9PROT|nr:hypothetical protein IMCC14465_04210 [alpha proteobacterium IMCC14465]